MTLDRRTFVKSAALAAALAAARGTSARAVLPAAPASQDGTAWNKAPCRLCGVGCHVLVGTRAGKVVAVAGDERADVNQGLLCVKGYHAGAILYGTDRLTTPLLRQHGRLVPIGWDAALDTIAERILADPAGFAIYGSGQWTISEAYLANKLMKAGLASNQIEASTHLLSPAAGGLTATDAGSSSARCHDDLEACDVAVLWDANLAETHPVLFSRLLDRRLRGSAARIIDVTTRRTRTSELADDVILLRPMTDRALVNGIAHLLLERGSFDQAFVERHCSFRREGGAGSAGQPIDLDGYRQALAPYTPEHVGRITGVSAADLSTLADVFGDRALRLASFAGAGPGPGEQPALDGLHLLSGHFGRPGDGPTTLADQPSTSGSVHEVGALSHALPGGRLVTDASHRAEAEQLWNLPAGRLREEPGFPALQLWKQFGLPYARGGDISTLWVAASNPARSLPDADALFARGRSTAGKFLIVSDVYPTATTAAADLVLPSSLWVEKHGIDGSSERRTQQWSALVAPPGDARDDAWQVLAVARRLFDQGFPGLRDKDGAFLFAQRDGQGQEIPAWDWDRYREVVVDEFVFEEYRAFTRGRRRDLAPYGEYVRRRGLRWPVVEQAGGRWRETRLRYVEDSDPFVAAGQGVQFYDSPAGDDRAPIGFRPHVAPPESPDDEYPFWLCTGPVLEHAGTGTLTLRVPTLRDAMPQAAVELHPKDAAALDLRTGDRVLLRSRRGELELLAWVGGRSEPQRGSVFVAGFDAARPIQRLTLAGAGCCAVDVRKIV